MASRKTKLRPDGFVFPTEAELQAAIQTFGMLGDRTRMRILLSLLQGEQTVNRLAEMVGVPQPTVSQHLAKLRMAGLVRQRREGGFVVYEVDRQRVRPLLEQALGEVARSAATLARRSNASPAPIRRRLDRGATSVLSGLTLTQGHSVSAVSSAGFAVNTAAVVASITIGTLLLAPLSRFARLSSQWLEGRASSPRPLQEPDRTAAGTSGPGADRNSRNSYRLSPGALVAMLAMAGIALGAIFLDISRFDPTGPALAWSPGVAVLSVGASVLLNRASQATTAQRGVVGLQGAGREREDPEVSFRFGTGA